MTLSLKPFQQTGISLCPTGNEDHKLHVRGLPNLIVGQWELELESDGEVEFVDEAGIGLFLKLFRCYRQSVAIHQF